jgi:protein-disulfide isomerase
MTRVLCYNIRAVVAGVLAILGTATAVYAEPVELELPPHLRPALSPEKTAELLKEPSALGDMTLGKAGASVTVIEYASFGCAVCRAFHKSTFARFKKAYIDTGKVHFILREFPIGKSSASAAIIARCVPAKDYFRITDKLMNTTAQWNGRAPDLDGLYKVVQETGLTRAAFDSCLTNQKINDGITRTKQQGRELGIQGTPTFFINGEKVRGNLTFEEMQKLIEEHLRSRGANPA